MRIFRINHKKNIDPGPQLCGPISGSNSSYGIEDDLKSKLKTIISSIGDDPTREGLLETPQRIIKSWEELYSGYQEDPDKLFTTFEDGTCQEMVMLKDVSFFSTCEHHMLPFFGTISIGYVPNGNIIGVSKLARLVEIYARRLQVQERLTAQIADKLIEKLNPKGVMVVCEAQHLCMIARGVEKPGTKMVTNAIRGAFTKSKMRSEFLTLIRQ